MGDQGDILNLGLGDQQSVERVAVDRRQAANAPGVIRRDREYLVAVGAKIGRQIVRGIQTTEPALDGDFPKAGHADDTARLGQGQDINRGLSKRLFAVQRPENDMGIEEHPQGPFSSHGKILLSSNSF